MEKKKQDKPVKQKGKNWKKKKVNFNPYAAGVERLSKMYDAGKGNSKHEFKNSLPPEERRKQNKKFIFSHATLEKYIYWWKRYVKWLQKQHLKARNWTELKKYVQQFLNQLIAEKKSPHTIKLAGCAINKCFQDAYLGDYDLPARRREDITKSRNHPLEYFLEMEKKYPDLVKFCLACGPRKGRELPYIRGTDLFWKNGKPYLTIRGKNGKTRVAELIGDEQTIQWVVELCCKKGDKKLFPKPPHDFDGHVFRALFACRMLLLRSRKLDTLEKEEKYFCRRDYKGVCADREAMRQVSIALGHGRVCVIAQSYLYPLVTMSQDIQKHFGLIPDGNFERPDPKEPEKKESSMVIVRVPEDLHSAAKDSFIDSHMKAVLMTILLTPQKAGVIRFPGNMVLPAFSCAALSDGKKE